jgi:hypothetical protein
MYTPVILSGALTVAGICGFFSRALVNTFLRYTGFITLADGLIGFGFHIRGVARKPGGWRLPVANIVMGPPIFAPLLFGTSAYFGVIASYLQREEEHGLRSGGVEASLALCKPAFGDDIRVGRFQKPFVLYVRLARSLWARRAGIRTTKTTSSTVSSGRRFFSLRS